MKLKGFIDNQNFPREKPACTTLTDFKIVQKYRDIFQGLVQYYIRCDNNRTIHYIDYILLYSCAKNLAHPHRTTIGFYQIW